MLVYNLSLIQYSQMQQLIHLLIYQLNVEIYINQIFQLLLIKNIQLNMVQVIVNQISLKIIILTKIKVKDHVCVMISYTNWNKICKLEVLMYIIILFV